MPKMTTFAEVATMTEAEVERIIDMPTVTEWRAAFYEVSAAEQAELAKPLRHAWTKCSPVPARRRMVYGKWFSKFRCPVCNNLGSASTASAICDGRQIRKAKRNG